MPSRRKSLRALKRNLPVTRSAWPVAMALSVGAQAHAQTNTRPDDMTQAAIAAVITMASQSARQTHGVHSAEVTQAAIAAITAMATGASNAATTSTKASTTADAGGADAKTSAQAQEIQTIAPMPAQTPEPVQAQAVAAIPAAPVQSAASTTASTAVLVPSANIVPTVYAEAPSAPLAIKPENMPLADVPETPLAPLMPQGPANSDALADDVKSGDVQPQLHLNNDEAEASSQPSPLATIKAQEPVKAPLHAPAQQDVNPETKPEAKPAIPEKPPVQDDNAEYEFDTRMFRGNGVNGALLERFNQRQTVLPGTYALDVWINQRFVERHDIVFQERDHGRVTPCLTPEQFDRLGILLPQSAVPQQPAQPRQDRHTPEMHTPETQTTETPGEPTAVCLDIAEHVPGASVNVRMDVLRLDVQVPQALTRQIPRGYVNPADLDPGASVGFVNYMGNYYHSWQKLGSNLGSGYLSLQGGMNVGLWQLRHQSNVNWTQGTGTRWNSTRTYVQRPLFSLRSQLTLGQTFTRGSFFSGLNYVGVNLRDDDRMLPDSQRGYAPVVRGAANTNARVSIRQNDAEIYQTTVAPGPFEITDLYPNSYSGDLEVEVLESDGTVQRYTIPFAAVPESLREGQYHYDVSLGRSHAAGKDSVFGDVVYQRGISNAATLYGGLRVAQGYQAVMAGGVYASHFGALGSDVTWARAQLPGRDTTSGWMMRFSYSNTITSTGTTVTLANYRYSTLGYQELSTVLALRGAGLTPSQAVNYRQRNRFDVRLSQQLGRWGQLSVSGSMQNYHDRRPRDTQYQLGYGTSFANGIGVNVAVMRQHISSVSGGFVPVAGRKQTTVMLSLSIPLGRSANMPSLSATMISGSGSGTGTGTSAQMQTSFGGSLDADQTLNYSLGGSYDRNARQAVWNGNLQKRFSSLTAGVGASYSSSARQLSGNVQGAVAVHAGGVTLGPYVSDTFALVYAPGAAGAKLLNSQTRIDGNGYAMVPSMTPYRYNRIMLDPGGMSSSAELLDGERRSAPYAGAVVKLTFQTRRGQALLIRTIKKSDGLPVPFGAEVFDQKDAEVGMVGQGGRIYARAEDTQGKLTVRWGDTAAEQCVVPYRFDGKVEEDQPLVRLEGVCGE